MWSLQLSASLCAACAHALAPSLRTNSHPLSCSDTGVLWSDLRLGVFLVSLVIFSFEPVVILGPFTFHIFVRLPSFLQLLISNFTILQSENILCMTFKCIEIYFIT